CRLYGIAPLVLLNANQGNPCPNRSYTRTVLGGGTLGSRQLQLDDVTDLVAGQSGASNLTAYWKAEAIFTQIDPTTNAVQLSKPLAKALPAGTRISVHTLKYLPLYPPGSIQFDQT